MIPRFTDRAAFRLPYVRVEDQPPYGYLEARFAQYRELQRAEAALRNGAQGQLSAHPHEVLPLKARKR